MTVRRSLVFAVILAVPAFIPPHSTSAEKPRSTQVLAEQIDQQLSAVLAAHSVEPAELADDYEFLRRVTLDLTGRIPTVHEIRSFVADARPDRRAIVVDQLLERPSHAAHLANVWRDWLVPELATVPDAEYFQTGFQKWLAGKFREKAGYDKIVRELISVPLPGTKEQAEYVYRDGERPNPLAFYAVKEAQPDKLAATATRAFLSIQLECAQCHDHPFAEWRQEQFWNQAAFFAGIERQGNGLFAPLIEDGSRRSVSAGDGKPRVGPAYLYGRGESIDPEHPSRMLFASWLTARENPYFARSAVNRVWALLFGFGLVQPIDDFHDQNPPSHPTILNELTEAFVAADFDLDYIFRALCRTKAYARTSRWTVGEVPDQRLFARMVPKGLSADQAWDSLSLAVGWHTSNENVRNFARDQAKPKFLEQFTPQRWPAEPETSIGQALSMMNGELISGATNLEKSPTLVAVTETPDWTDEQRLTTLYLITLGRPLESAEREKLLNYLSRTESTRSRRFEDIFWMLLNSAEFRLNH